MVKVFETNKDGKIEFTKCELETLLNEVPVHPELSTEIDEILDYLDEKLHPIVSPEHWDIYSKLHDMISQLSFIKPDVIRCEDCKHASDDEYCHCKRVTWWNGKDDYCSRAERREDEARDNH